jgi:hypothetical protein
VLLITALLVLGGSLTAAPPAGAFANGSLTGRVTSGGSALSGMNVWLYAVPSGVWVKAAATNATGNYSFPSLAPGTYRVQVWHPTNAYPTTWYQHGTTFATGDNVVVPSGGAATPADVDVATTGSITGTVRHNGVGVTTTSVLLTRSSDGVLVASVATNGSGAYAFNNVVPGTYRIAFLDSSGQYPAAGYYAEQPDVGSATPVTVVAGSAIVADQNVYLPSEQPVPPYTGNASGPTVAVIGDSITQLGTFAIHQALDPSSHVAVRGISLQRVGQLQPVADKFALTSPQQVIIAAGNNDSIQAYPLNQTEADLETMIATFPSASCITVETLNATTANGAFNQRIEALNAFIRALPATHPQVQIADWHQVRADYFALGEPAGTWTTDAIHLTPLGMTRFAQLMADAVAACGAPHGSISGTAFGDANGNGVLDGAEAPLANVIFNLTGTDTLGNPVDRSVATAADGTWSFADVGAGTYDVDEEVPFTLALPLITVGTTGGTETNTGVDGIVLGPGTAGSGYTFGNPLSPASVYGTVYADSNSNGAREVGEKGLDRVALALDGMAANGDPVHLVTESATGGTWAFRGLNPGTYSITETQPNGFASSSATVGTTFGGTVLPHAINGLVVTANGTGTGYLFGEVPVPSVQWAGTAPSSIATVARSVTSDAAGNSYVTGAFYGSSVFGTGPSAITLVSAGGGDVYLAKYDAAGQIVWAKRAGGAGEDESLKVAINAAGKLVIAGDFDGSATFGSGPGAVTLSGAEDAFVAEYDTSGSLVWVRQVAGVTRSVAASAAIDGAGNVFVTGWYVGGASFSGTPMSGAGAATAFVARYLADGTFDWVRSPSSTFGSLGFDVAVDSAGNAYVGGADGGIDFGNGDSYLNVGGLEAFAAKYLANGSVGWTRQFAGIGNDIVFGIGVDPATNQVYLSGTFAWTVDFGSGNTLTSAGLSEAFVARLTTSGATVWARSVSSTGDDMAARLSIGNGRVTITGSYGGTATLGSIELLGYGQSDAFVASYDLDGDVQWARPIAGPNGEGGWGTTTLPSGDIVATGVFAIHTAVMPGPVEVGLNGGWFPTQFLTRLFA